MFLAQVITIVTFRRRQNVIVLETVCHRLLQQMQSDQIVLEDTAHAAARRKAFRCCHSVGG